MKNLRRITWALVFSSLLSVAAQAATTTLTIKDGNGISQTVPAESNAGSLTPHTVQEVAGAPVSTNNPSPVASQQPSTDAPVTGTALPSGGSGLTGWLSAIFMKLSGTLTVSRPASSGTDASGSAPGLLNILATATVSTAGAYRVQNQSGSQLQVILDNGSGTPTVILLGSGGQANSQGGDTSPEIPWFVGRIRVAGPAGSQFAFIHN
jgi:hypothetical protein